MKSKMMIVAVAALLAACSDNQPQYAPAAPAPAAQAPVVVQQGGADAGDMLAAGAVGMIAGQALANRQAAPAPHYGPGYSHSYQPRPVIKNKTVIVQKNVIVQKKVVINKPSRSFSRSRRK